MFLILTLSEDKKKPADKPLIKWCKYHIYTGGAEPACERTGELGTCQDPCQANWLQFPDIVLTLTHKLCTSCPCWGLKVTEGSCCKCNNSECSLCQWSTSFLCKHTPNCHILPYRQNADSLLSPEAPDTWTQGLHQLRGVAGAPEVPEVIMPFLEVPAADRKSCKCGLRRDAFTHLHLCILF